MDATTTATITGLLLPACPALTAVCLYRATHRTNHARATATAWLLSPASVVEAVLAAQHTHGWGVVGWIVQLATTMICIAHLSGIRLMGKGRSRKKRSTTKPRTSKDQDKPAVHPVLKWGVNFWGTHRPWLPKQRPQALTEHREQITKAMAEEARAMGRMDVLDESMADLHEAYGGKR